MQDKNFIKKLYNSQTKKIFDLLLAHGEARFIGGCVRDAILGIEFTDIDIATNLLPDEVTQILESVGIKVIPTGIKHGTVTALVDNKSFEITTLRQDIACNGRHAEVSFTDSWQIDSARRDFTINSLSSSFDGVLYDYHNGIDDLENHKVKFIGNPEDRINEDYLRILRFFRFSGKYGNCIFDAETTKLCKKFRYHISQLSDERIYEEFSKIALHNSYSNVFHEMINNNILESIFPEKKLNADLVKSLTTASNNLKLMPEMVTVLASILYGSGSVECSILKKKSDQKLLNRMLQFPFQEFHDIENQIKKLHYLTGEYFKQFFLLFFALYHHEIYNMLMIDLFTIYSKKDKNIFPVNGLDLLKLGFKDGVEIGKMLAKLENLWIDDNFRMSKEELLEQINILGTEC